mmetsp:Transcript_8251/g.23635  ORF Transcript_8251/g.23635 Transcript_8251/m.23635 type:complete len:262 (-) Transcript_8251:233-1018(-)
MSNNAEEQELEIEALTSIFQEGKEFFRVSDTEFKLKLVPFPADEEENHVAVTLHVTYTPEYPEAPPDWDLEDVTLPDEKLSSLKSTIEETINSSLGMAMIYSVAEACQDFLKENNVKELSMHEQMLQRMADANPKEEGEEGDDDDEEYDDDDGDGPNPEEEWKGLADKPTVPESERITLDVFQSWKVKFEQEMIEVGVLKRETNKAKSGKEWFLEKSKETEGASPSDQAAKQKTGEELVYDASLFNEMDDEDLDDLSAGED